MMNFEEILQMRQKELKHALSKHLKQMDYEVTGKRGFLYGRGDIPVLLVAHLDTVHKETASIICRSEDGRFMMSPQGIGGDDRCGVYMILQIINQVRCHVLFCEDEERGGIGAKEFAKSGMEVDVNFIVEMDRRGNNDAVFYNCDNPEFTEFVCSFGFQKARGSFSDISVVAPYLKTAAVNISAGYYGEHHLHETIDCMAMENNVERIIRMAQAKTDKYQYMSYYEAPYRSWYKQESLFDWYGDERGKEKFLMELPCDTRLVVNGCEIEATGTYLIDGNGKVYASIPELDAAVLTENVMVYNSQGKEPVFSTYDARLTRVISMEDALEQLERDAG